MLTSPASELYMCTVYRAAQIEMVQVRNLLGLWAHLLQSPLSLPPTRCRCSEFSLWISGHGLSSGYNCSAETQEHWWWVLSVMVLLIVYQSKSVACMLAYSLASLTCMMRKGLQWSINFCANSILDEHIWQCYLNIFFVVHDLRYIHTF